MNAYSGKRFCVLSNSVSTYEGYTPASAVFYDAYYQSISGVTSVNDTWWMQVINRLGGVLGINDSYSGSTVYGTQPTAGCSDLRIAALGKNGTPDVILIYMGGNDWRFNILPERFSNAYRTMLSKLTQFYPNAEIWCATLLQGHKVDNTIPAFRTAKVHHPQRLYSDLIRKEVSAAGCHIADLGESTYPASDGVHPTREGMCLLAQRWLRAIENTL